MAFSRRRFSQGETNMKHLQSALRWYIDEFLFWMSVFPPDEVLSEESVQIGQQRISESSEARKKQGKVD